MSTAQAQNYRIRTRINKPVAEVFKAVTSSDSLIKYFVDSSSHDLLPGQKVSWHWDHYGANEVTVKQVIDNELIELTLDSENWDKTVASGYDVTVTIAFEALDDRTTMVSISESGWLHDEPGYKASHENCGGWQDMLLCLKGYLEYGIDLRK